MSAGIERRQALAALAALAGHAWAGASTPATDAPNVRMPGPPFFVGSQPFFQGDLAALALAKAGWNPKLQILGTQTWPRQVRELRDGFADLAPLPVHDERLYDGYGMQRVDFPLRRGLLGVRQLVVRSDRVGEFTALRSLAQLQRHHRMGYGAEWGDLPHMRQLGFRVVTARSTELLYDGLQRGEIDFLSRGVNETGSELQYFNSASASFTAVPGVLLFYPLDDCFFVSQRRDGLHEALTRGLAMARRDGSYAALFQQHFGAALTALAGSKVWALHGYPRPVGLDLKEYDVIASGLLRARVAR